MANKQITLPASQDRTVFYDVNSDFTGNRNVAGSSQEVVQYHTGTAIRIWYNDIPNGYETHWHSALEIIMPVDNWYEATVDGETYHIVPGDILFIPPGELHSLTSPETGNRFIYVMDISPLTRLHGFAAVQPLLSAPLHIRKNEYPAVYDEILELLVQIRNVYFSKSDFMELTIFSLLLQLFVTLGKNHINNVEMLSGMRVYKQKEYMEKFRSVMDYIDTHYMEELNLEDIARSIGFSKYHFSRLFKQYTGYTFCAYICYRRIKVAEELLAQPDLSITEIALQAGFPSISTFNRVFKQQKNCTPSVYREKNNRYLNVSTPLPDSVNPSASDC